MRTIVCRLPLPENAPSGADFQTPDLESWPDGGYEISSDGRLSLVAPFARGGLPDTTQCGPASFTGTLRFYASGPQAGRERRAFVAEFRDGRAVSGLRAEAEP